MHALVAVLYLALCVLQTCAVFAGLTEWLALHWAAALVLAPLAAFTPVVGTGAAFVGAVQAWGLEPSEAATLFAGPLVFVAVLYVAIRTASKPEAPTRDGPRRGRSPAPASRGAEGKPSASR